MSYSFQDKGRARRAVRQLIDDPTSDIKPVESVLENLGVSVRYARQADDQWRVSLETQAHSTTDAVGLTVAWALALALADLLGAMSAAFWRERVNKAFSSVLNGEPQRQRGELLIDDILL